MNIITFFALILLIVLLLKWIVKRKRLFSTFERLGIPGPKPSFFVGNIPLLAKQPYFDVYLMEKYGPIYGFFAGAKPLLGVSDPELLKIIQVKETRIFHVRNSPLPQIGVPSQIIHLTVPFSTGQRWKQNRDSITHAYTTSKLKMMNDIINQEIDKTLTKITEFSEKQESFELDKIYSPMFGRASLQISFGIKINPGEKETMKSLLDCLERAVVPRLTDLELALTVCFPELESIVVWFRSFRESIRKAFNLPSFNSVQEMCDAVIRERMNNKANNYTDALQSMINAIKEQKKLTGGSKNSDGLEYAEKSHMQEEDLLYNCLYLAITLYDFIKTATVHGTYELANSPRVQEKLREEIFEVNGSNQYITYESLSKMKYLDQVYNEVLRLHPTVPLITNRVAGEDYYYKGQLIPKGTVLFVPQTGLTRSSSNFSDPDSFIPERFDDKSKIDPYIYQPFGIGPRHCPGMRLSQCFGKIVLARMIQAFKLSVDPKTKEVVPDLLVIANHPKNPIHLKATPV